MSLDVFFGDQSSKQDADIARRLQFEVEENLPMESKQSILICLVNINS